MKRIIKKGSNDLIEDEFQLEGGNSDYRDDGKSAKNSTIPGDNFKKGQRKLKLGINEEHERRRKRALFGSRATPKIFDSSNANNN